MNQEEFELAFRYNHLPSHLQAISAPFCELARNIWDNTPNGHFKNKSLDYILLAKDAAVRAEVK